MVLGMLLVGKGVGLVWLVVVVGVLEVVGLGYWLWRVER